MTKLFRHIRQSLVNENKMGKYFKYAIGEIILVVIGILIALQINNWNEIQKEKVREQQLLRSLREEFKQNINELEFDHELNLNCIISCEKVEMFIYLTNLKRIYSYVRSTNIMIEMY